MQTRRRDFGSLFGLVIHVPLRMKSNHFSDPWTFPVVPAIGRISPVPLFMAKKTSELMTSASLPC